MAIRLLDDPQLEGDYAAAWDEWHESGEAEAWSVTVADGLAMLRGEIRLTDLEPIRLSVHPQF